MVEGHADDVGAFGAILFENADWRVLTDGLEHRRTGYFIGRESLGMRRGRILWEWPLHLAEKTWCIERPFREAFLAAIGLFEIEPDDFLASSFVAGFRTARGGAAMEGGFAALGDLVRPKAASRRRSGASPGRIGVLIPEGFTPAAAVERRRSAAM